MALIDWKADMVRCERCSNCKWVPWQKGPGQEFAQVCPSISKHNFHAYSGAGRYHSALAYVTDKIEYTDGWLDIIYHCQMCGACDITCKTNRDMEPQEMLLALRAQCVEDGQLVPELMAVMEGLKAEDNMMQAKKADRGNWAKGLKIKDLTKEKGEVLYFAGCRISFDESLHKVAKTAISVLQKAGVDVGIFGTEEACCGGRSYEMGYQGEIESFSENNAAMFKAAGIKKIVVSCSDCYHAFKVLYHKIDRKLDVEVLHITEYIAQLIKEGKLKFSKNVPLRVTYHDPCHLGRLGEDWIPWKGVEKKVMGQLCLHDPPKVFRRGKYGIYDAPRDILRSIPGVKLTEMKRIEEYSFCCGAGGGCMDSDPDYSLWVAKERVTEAKTTGAEAMVTACGWCERNFSDAVNDSGDALKILDIIELVEQAI
ncbi:MAG: (Fe-S)-binding protein [Proteobacteria bacterium]|nr:(Fe-S)-binding protein [Pseudomonadota bacterium]